MFSSDHMRVLDLLSDHSLDYQAIVYKIAGLNPSAVIEAVSSMNGVPHVVDLERRTKEVYGPGCKKIAAIKFYRAEVGCGLREAKEAVERICDCAPLDRW